MKHTGDPQSFVFKDLDMISKTLQGSMRDKVGRLENRMIKRGYAIQSVSGMHISGNLDMGHKNI